MPGSKKEHKQEVTLDDLAQMVAGGFTEIRQEMTGGFTEIREEMVDGFAEIRKEMTNGFAEVNQHFTEVEDRLTTLEKGQLEIFRELDGISRKQDGMLLSLDDTVSRDEFSALALRVETLEAVW